MVARKCIVTAVCLILISSFSYSEQPKLFSIEFYSELIGKSALEIATEYQDYIEYVSIPDHSPDTYKKVIKFSADSESYLFIDISKEGLLEFIKVNSYKYKTNEGMSLASFYCDVIEIYPDYRVEDSWRDYVGKSTLITTPSKPVTFVFGKPRDIDLQYYTPEAAQCNERILAIEIGKRSR